MNEKTARNYAERFDRVFDYIERHLDEPLSVERLSRQAAFSCHHFQRQFSEYVGVSVTRYVQALRLQRASYQLVFNEGRRIIDIALEAGFENPESFSRAFKRSFGQTLLSSENDPHGSPGKSACDSPNEKGADP